VDEEPKDDAFRPIQAKEKAKAIKLSSKGYLVGYT
jgi:hypothetical protein